MKWDILISEEYEDWFSRLPQKHKMAITTDLKVLENIGPQLGRPYVDQIKGSNINNLKELRTKCEGHIYRSLFAFNPQRKAVVLCGSDKRGKNQETYYRKLIAKAEYIFQNHINTLAKKTNE